MDESRLEWTGIHPNLSECGIDIIQLNLDMGQPDSTRLNLPGFT